VIIPVKMRLQIDRSGAQASVARIAPVEGKGALVQYDGNVFAFCNNHLCHLNLENFLHSQTSLEDAQSDSRHFAGGKMDTKEIVHYPVYS